MKKIIALLLILLATTFCFAACGENEDDKPTDDTGDLGDLELPSDFEWPLVPIEPD